MTNSSPPHKYGPSLSPGLWASLPPPLKGRGSQADASRGALSKSTCMRRWKRWRRHTHQTNWRLKPMRYMSNFALTYQKGKKVGEPQDNWTSTTSVCWAKKNSPCKARSPLCSKDSHPFRTRCARKPERCEGCKASAPCPGWTSSLHRGDFIGMTLPLIVATSLGSAFLKKLGETFQRWPSSVITVTVFLLYFTKMPVTGGRPSGVNVTRSPILNASIVP